MVEGFFTHLKNKFTVIDNPDVERQKLVVNAKGENAKVYGINLEGRAAYGRFFDLQMGLTLQKSLFDEAQQPLEGVEEYREFMRTPTTYGYWVATWKPARRFAATLSGNYTGAMYVPHAKGSGDPAKDRFAASNKIEKVSPFWEVHTKLSYDIPVLEYSTLQLNAGVQNIFNAYQKDFDTGAGRASDYIYGPASPRSLFVGIKMSF